MPSLARHRSGGPRPDITAPPLDLSDLPDDRAGRAVAVANLLPCPTSRGARLELRPWQEHIMEVVLAPGGVRTAVVAIPRGNGKSTLAAALGLWALVDGPPSAQVSIVAGVSERQARIAFNTARRMVEINPTPRAQARHDRA
jgi:phage terminase large subunit-like protein